MDALDKAGYFSFFQETMRIVDNIVTNFSPQDVRDLADNIVLILNTVKQLTQPDIMHMLQELTDTYRESRRAVAPRPWTSPLWACCARSEIQRSVGGWP